MSSLRLCRDWKPILCQSADFFTYGPSKLIEVYDGERHVPALLIGRSLALKIDRAIHSGHADSELRATEGKKMDDFVDRKAKAEGDIATLIPQINRLERLVEHADLEDREKYLARLSELQTEKKMTEVTVHDMEVSHKQCREIVEKSTVVAKRKWTEIGMDFDEIWKSGGFIDQKHLAAPAVKPELVHQAQHHLRMLHNLVRKAKQAFDSHVKKTNGSLTFDGLRLREALRIAEEEYKKHYEQWLQLGLLKQHLTGVDMEIDGEASGYDPVVEQPPNPPAGNRGNAGNAEIAGNNRGNDVQNAQKDNNNIHARKRETAPREHNEGPIDLGSEHHIQEYSRTSEHRNRQQNNRVQNNHRQNANQRRPPQKIDRPAKTGVNQPSHLAQKNTDRELRISPEPQEPPIDWSSTRSLDTEERNVENFRSRPRINWIPAHNLSALPAQQDVPPVPYSISTDDSQYPISTNDSQRPHDAPRNGEKLAPSRSHSQESSFESTNRSNNTTSSARKRKASGTREINDEPTHKRQRLPSHDPPLSTPTHRQPSTPLLRERGLERRDSRSPNSSDGLRFPSRARKSRVPSPISPFQYSYRRQDRNGTREASSQHRGTARGQRIHKETSAERQQRNPLRTLHEDDELAIAQGQPAAKDTSAEHQQQGPHPTLPQNDERRTAQGHHVEKRASVERQQRSPSHILRRDDEHVIAQEKRAEKYTPSSVERQKRNPPRSLPEDDEDML